VAPLRVVVATGNSGKARELGRLLGDGFVVEPLPATVSLPEETGSTFAENALLKAGAVAAALGGRVAVLADDSGVAVDELGGLPGVHSARYAGEAAGDDANNHKLLADLAGSSDRSARFVCALALVLPGGVLVTAEGELPGRIVAAPRGARGFGYDPLFQPDGFAVTVAEMEDGQKDAVSHRARAVAALRGRLGDRGHVE
jgi:XTP/dITP diphosphohydrolase